VPAEDALRAFNASPDDEADRLLHACCASSTWVRRVRAGRPYATPAQLLEAAERACRELSAEDVAEALAAHSRIGDRTEGASTEAQWSRQEQASVSDSRRRDPRAAPRGQRGVRAALRPGLPRPRGGRTPAQMLAELERRLGNDPETESREVVEQLAQITRLRVERLVQP
jgi:2-oxo-4-hydroxy-4-carboxy-5-ureidoimidazoline decarboxylase